MNCFSLFGQADLNQLVYIFTNSFMTESSLVTLTQLIPTMFLRHATDPGTHLTYKCIYKVIRSLENGMLLFLRKTRGGKTKRQIYHGSLTPTALGCEFAAWH